MYARNEGSGESAYLRTLARAFVGRHCYKYRSHVLARIPILYEAVHDETDEMIFASSEDSNQSEHPPDHIRAFTMHSVGN